MFTENGHSFTYMSQVIKPHPCSVRLKLINQIKNFARTLRGILISCLSTKSLCCYADANKLNIYFNKTKFMLFNPSHSTDFLQKFDVGGTPDEMVEHTNLLRVVLSSYLSWSAHTNYMVERVKKKMWLY